MQSLRIGLIGDESEGVLAHSCIPRALAISATSLGISVDTEWISTDSIRGLADSDRAGFDGYWCVPGSPYKDREGALELIRYARILNIPYLGTCGGYQHAVLEFAINELGLKSAELEEENPMAEMPLITALACRLVDESRKITITENSELNRIFAKNEISEEYRCGYGVNPEYLPLFDNGRMKFVAFNEERVPQAFELIGHRFFMGTAFQPERSARTSTEHPVITHFLRSMMA